MEMDGADGCTPDEGMHDIHQVYFKLVKIVMFILSYSKDRKVSSYA